VRINSVVWAVKLDSGSVTVRNSLIDLMGAVGAAGVVPTNFNLGLDTIGATLDGLTIVNGGSNSRGILVQADSEPSPGGPFPDDMTVQGETVTATVSNTVIDGVDVPLDVQSDRGETANVTVDYSNYDDLESVVDNNLNGGADATGVTNFTTTNRTELVPGFVGGGNFQLAPTSALIDIGDPAPAPGVFDIDGDARALDASFDCNFVQRRDIGADEFAGAAQGTPTGCNPMTTPQMTTDPCPPLRAKVARLSRKIKRASDPEQKAKLKTKRRKVRKQLRALGC
jgi:hypothetical protein